MIMAPVAYRVLLNCEMVGTRQGIPISVYISLIVKKVHPRKTILILRASKLPGLLVLA